MHGSDRSLIEYYDRRAPEYERIYAREDPVRRNELLRIGREIRDVFRGRRVLEVACGTGYWTRFLADVAESVTATDASSRVLVEAERKGLGPHVGFRLASAYELEAVPGAFDAALAAFWLSHVPRHRIATFLGGLHGRLEPGARVFMVDNTFVAGVGGELVEPAGSGDTYKRRVLDTGEEYLVLKNYHSEGDLRRLLAGVEDLSVSVGECYWWVTYRVAPEGGAASREAGSSDRSAAG